MSTFAFNKIFILESLLPKETQTGTLLEQRINHWAPTQGINCQVVTFPVHSMQDWEVAWNSIYTSITQMGNNPIVHLEMHGNKTQVGIDKGQKGKISLIDVFKKVQKANVLSHNNTFLSLAVCEGLNVIRSLGVYQPMPFCGVMGSEESLGNQELLENYTIFYKSFLKTLNLDAADAAMKAAGIEADKYKLVKPEQVFMNAYLGYLESYKSDEKIVNKALKAAQEGGVVFSSGEEKARFIRDYRCQLLTTESKEYRKAVDTFFMFNKYPEIASRFIIPQSLREFKEYVGSRGNGWLLLKRKVTDEDVKAISIDLLQRVHDFCKKNNIRYSLAYGTLLGAVRHKGFIPWDDDIDILMLRPDYEKFISTFNNSSDGTYSVASYKSDSHFRYALAKVVNNSTVNSELGYNKYGLGIDLFPIDKIPSDKSKAILLFKRHAIYWNMFMFKMMKWDRNRSLYKNLSMLLAKTFLIFVPYSAIHYMMHKGATHYINLQYDYMLGCLFAPYGMKNLMPKEVFDKTISMPFEQNEYCCLKAYDTYLSNLYGDYMQLPPIEKRVTHHDIDAYWK